jgi:hypothetical protein
MTQEQKIKLTDSIIDFLANNQTEAKKEIPVQVRCNYLKYMTKIASIYLIA